MVERLSLRWLVDIHGCTTPLKANTSNVTGLRATHQLCVTHLLSINQISVGGLAANEYALDWVPLC
jgi:hypothetical protein